MKYLDEFRDPRAGQGVLDAIRRRATRRWTVMEVCGGQTHTLLRAGIDELLAGVIELIHGPGCPVCVTPLAKIDRALAIARVPGVILASFGDMLRVPGSRGDLLAARAAGADVRVVYSPMDAVRIAQDNPRREVVFFAVGFETTAPANAMAVLHAQRRGLRNFFALVSQVLVPPAIQVVLDDPDSRVQGFIAPGHVCAVMGLDAYVALAARHHVPFVVAGFEPLDLLQGLSMLVDLLEAGQAGVRNQYTRSVRQHGNLAAQQAMREVFELTDMAWRGIGVIPRSGLRLRARFASYDAETRFGVAALDAREAPACIAGQVLQGKRKPFECPAFARDCTPERPLGAPMVSAEGACAAYYAFRRSEAPPQPREAHRAL